MARRQRAMLVLARERERIADNEQRIGVPADKTRKCGVELALASGVHDMSFEAQDCAQPPARRPHRPAYADCRD